MGDRKLLERITFDPKVMAGKPVIKGTRLTVGYVLGLLAHGASVGEIMDEHEGIKPNDIWACLLFASGTLEAVTAEAHGNGNEGFRQGLGLRRRFGV